MSRRLGRIVLFVATSAALWLVALPAFASGPLCDDRGATRVAPSPTMIVQHQSIEVWDLEGDLAACFERLEKAGYHGSRAPAEITIAEGADASLPLRITATPPIIAADVATLPACEVSARARPGILSRVERPPRT
jgi:hypothetical protein